MSFVYLCNHTLCAFQVGRALGPSILDLTESNPLSRLRSSEFRNLQGLRTALRGDIERNVSKNVSENTTSKVIDLVLFWSICEIIDSTFQSNAISELF